MPGLADVGYHTAENWIDRPQLPAHLVVLGGGYTGLEMAQFYRRMGSAVTVVEEGPEIARKEDPEVALALRTLLESEGIAFRLEHRVARVEKVPEGVRLSLRRKTGSRDARRVRLFVAAGAPQHDTSVGDDRSRAGG